MTKCTYDDIMIDGRNSDFVNVTEKILLTKKIKNCIIGV